MITKQLITIARFTIQESIYNKSIQLALFVLITTFTTGYFLTDLMIGSRLKVLMDFCLLSYQIFVFSFILFFVIPFFGKPSRLKMLSLFIFRSISRPIFIAGVFLGFTIILCVASIFFFTASFIYLWSLYGYLMTHLSIAFAAIFFEAIFLAATGILLSLLLPNLLSYACIIAIYIISYTSHSWLLLTTKKANPLGAFLAYAFYYLLPDLSLLDIKSTVIYQLPFPADSFLLTVLYTLLISSLFLIVSFLVFKKKNI